MFKSESSSAPFPLSNYIPLLLGVASSLLAGTGCNTQPAEWNWFQWPQSNQQPSPEEDGAVPVAALTGQEQSQSAPERVDPKVESFIGRLEGFDKKALKAPSDSQPAKLEREPQRNSRSKRPSKATGNIDTVDTANAAAANNPLSLVETAAAVPVSEINTTSGDAANPLARPQVLGVAVEADTAGVDAESMDRATASNTPLSARPTEQVSAEQYLARLRVLSEQSPHDTNLQWRINMQERALGKAPTAKVSEDLPEDQRRLMLQSMQVVDELERAAADPSRAADEALKSINQLKTELQGYAALRVPTVQLCTRVTAFGVYDVLAESELVPFRANRAIVYTEVENFQSVEKEPGTWQTRLACQLELLTADGKSVWRHEEPTVEDISRRRRSDFFLAQLVTFPTTLAPGNYVLKVTIEDQLADKVTQGSHALTIGAIESVASGS